MAVLAALSNICLAEDLSKKLEKDWANVVYNKVRIFLHSVVSVTIALCSSDSKTSIARNDTRFLFAL